MEACFSDQPFWHRLLLATICQLWAAYQHARHQPDASQSAGASVGQVLSSCRKALLGDWRLATVTIRQTRAFNTSVAISTDECDIIIRCRYRVLSDCLRGRNPMLTRVSVPEGNDGATGTSSACWPRKRKRSFTSTGARNIQCRCPHHLSSAVPGLLWPYTGMLCLWPFAMTPARVPGSYPRPYWILCFGHSGACSP